MQIWGEYYWLNLHINPGALAGIMGRHPWLILVLTGLIIPVVVYLAYTTKEENAPVWSLGLLLGGALGNLFDRLFIAEPFGRGGEWIGGVRDFIDIGVSARMRWPVFNVADIGITVGVIVYLVYTLFLAPKADEESSDSNSDASQASS